ncbi:hypothetical protein BDN71DRAFT_1431660 [Pleurotus eryngii]|uniref:Uncharacterized protein n=1 Tax=Pleurotus eryngii TaxID=5323 RepID=A0A9P5ZZI3_PLEER|nr:hypothetical protein BDN71DRAFT_1431660 [Pleurotus eryngii]
MSATANTLFTEERLEALNRLACKVLLQTKEMVNYIEGSGMSEGHNLEFLESVTQATKIALSKLLKSRECDREDDGLWGACSYDIGERVIKMACKGDSIQSGNTGKRASEKSGSTNKKKKGNDQGKNKKLTEEEDTATARLNRGYSQFSLEEITRKLQTSTQQAANWRQQIEWDKGVDRAAGTENRIEEREKIKLATDWVKKDAKWIKQYNNWMFDLRRAEEVKNAKALLSEEAFRKWKGVERRKYAERYGSIVLLDPLWNLTAFGRGNRTADFASYMSYQLQKPLLK